MEFLRKATFEDIDSVVRICEAMKEKYKETKMFLWNEHYPTREHFEEDLNNQGLYVFVREHSIIGSVSMMPYLIEEGDAKDGVLYVGRFMIDPLLQNQGLGTKLFYQMGTIVQQMGYHKVEGLVSTKNVDAMRLYERLGMVNEGYRKTPWEEYGETYQLYSYTFKKMT